MPPHPQIGRLSGWLDAGASATILVLPLLVAHTIWGFWADPDSLLRSFGNLPPETTVSPGKALIVTGIAALQLIPGIVLLLQMRGLFRRYRMGEILTAACAGHIRRIGQFLLVLAAIRLAMPTLQGFAMTLGNPPGARILTVGINSDIIALALTGGLLVVIGWAMAEAARAAEENAGFI